MHFQLGLKWFQRIVVDHPVCLNGTTLPVEPRVWWMPWWMLRRRAQPPSSVSSAVQYCIHLSIANHEGSAKRGLKKGWQPRVMNYTIRARSYITVVAVTGAFYIIILSCLIYLWDNQASTTISNWRRNKKIHKVLSQRHEIPISCHRERTLNFLFRGRKSPARHKAQL